MSLQLVLLFILAGLHLVMGLFVLLQSRSDTTNRYFFGFVVSIVGWLLANYFSNSAGIGHSGLVLINKLVFVFPALCAFFVLMFSIGFTKMQAKIRPAIRALIALFAVLIVVTSFSDAVVSNVTAGSNGVYNITFGTLSPLYFVYLLVYFGLVIPIFVTSLRNTSSRASRVKYQYIVAGVIVSFALAIICNLFIPLVFHSYRFVGVGPYATLVLISAITYAIVKHKLFDLRIVVARSVAYILLLGTSAAVYAGVIFAASRYLLSGSDATAQTATYTILALLLAYTFQPLQRLFERLTDQIFFQDRYDPAEVLDSLSRVLVSEIDIDPLLAGSLEILCQKLHLQFGQLIIFNHDKVYRVGHFGTLPKRLLVAPELAKLGPGQVVVSELNGGERKRLMDDHDISLSLGLKTREEFVGYLLLGTKLSGDTYTKADIELLATVGKQLAVGIANAKAYAEIQAFNLTLQDRVNHATGRLRVANRHLKELDKTKDEFISMASHQLRTPLTTIKGYLSMMTEGDAGKLTSTQTEFVGYAFDASERMVNLISDLLNVSRLQAGRFLIQTKPTDMNVMVADEVRQLQQHAVNKGLSLSYVAPRGEMPLVDLDEGKTRQVIMNFIDNAIYYTKQGGVTVKLTRHDDNMRLEVSDTGIGVPEAAKKKLFSKFFRAENAQGIRPDGTGLGLYLAKRVIADQNGTIIFRSTEGHGSTFGFELPIKRASGKAS